MASTSSTTPMVDAPPLAPYIVDARWWVQNIAIKKWPFPHGKVPPIAIGPTSKAFLDVHCKDEMGHHWWSISDAPGGDVHEQANERALAHRVENLGGSIRTSQNCHSSQMGTTPKRGLKNHFGKLHNCALQGTPRKTCELSKMTVCRRYYMCQSKVMYSFQIWALQCPCQEKSNCSMSSAGAFQTTLQNVT